MNKERLQTLSEKMLGLGFLVKNHLMKPMREIERERNEFPPGYIHVLGWLKSKSGPVSMSDLACASFISKPNLTIMVDRLHAEGLVERSADTNDRRVVNVALSPKGMKYLLRHKAEVSQFIEGRLALLDDVEQERLMHAIDDITGILNTVVERQNQASEKK